MLKHSDAILKLATALGVLLAGAGVGFYYGIFLPSQDNAEHAKAAQAEYNDCIGFAEMSYKRRWAGSCQAMHDADVAAFDDCADNLFSTERGCRAKHPIRPASDCALPARMARELTGARDTRKRECLAKLQAVQGSASLLDQTGGAISDQ